MSFPVRSRPLIFTSYISFWKGAKGEPMILSILIFCWFGAVSLKTALSMIALGIFFRFLFSINDSFNN